LARELKEDLDFLVYLRMHQEEQIRIAVERDGANMLGARLFAVVPLAQHFVELHKRLRKLWTLISDVGMATDAITVSPGQVFDNRMALDAIWAARHENSDPMSIDMTLTAPFIDVASEVAVLTDPRLEVGDQTYVELIAFVAKPEVVNRTENTLEIRIATTRPRSMAHRRYRIDEMDKYSFDEAARAAMKELAKDGVLQVVTSPWMNFAKR
jgi:hypothetical protein